MTAVPARGVWDEGQVDPALLSPPTPIRLPEEVCTAEALSANKASALSFVRALVRRMARERWKIETAIWELDDEGRGTVAYRIETAERPLHFVIYSDNLPDDQKSERIVGQRYDGVGYVGQGEIDRDRVERLRLESENFVLGRADNTVVGFTRMNRSSSAFNAAVEALAAGRQPHLPGGYLLRNNGFWGNGRHGTAIYPSFAPEHPLSHPYSGEMMTLYMWRHFANDLAEHAARVINPDAARLSPVLKRHLGLGNASGLGMVPFVIAHPKRIHAWVVMRELAIAHALGEAVAPDGPEVDRLIELVARCIAYFTLHDRTGRDMYAPSAVVRGDLARIAEALAAFREAGVMLGAQAMRPWQTLVAWARGELNRESVEVLHSLLIELYPERAFELSRLASAPGDYRSDVDPAMTLGALAGLIRANYGWALALDVATPEARHHFWYYSEENVEPRLGERGVDPGDDREAFVDVPGAVQALLAGLEAQPSQRTVAEFLLGHPEHRFMTERVQSLAELPYGEIRGHVSHRDFQACHLIRFALSLLGMEDFDPRSSLWVRGTFLQGAPIAQDLAAGFEGDWIYPLEPDLNDC
jgi:hypothetical protein